jgi:hypothetical protein
MGGGDGAVDSDAGHANIFNLGSDLNGGKAAACFG